MLPASSQLPIWLMALILGLCGLRSGTHAGEVALDTVGVSVVIDLHLDQRLRVESLVPATPASDAAFVRRVTLDLAGRIPTAAETREFLEADAANKRSRLVDRLLQSPDCAIHLSNELDGLLLAQIKEEPAWREYLLDATRHDRPWNQIFREIMLPERERPGESGPASFLRERVKDLDTLTNDASALLFGVNISCAKCHDHPLVADWQQHHYFGMASFFKRTYATKSNLLAEQFDGRVKFTSVSGDEYQADFMFLTGTSVEEPRTDHDESRIKELKDRIKLAQKDAQADPPPLPDFSPREQLVRLALQPDGTDYFARNMVNRTWARLMGRGLVHPLDQMHSENPPSHPELLDWLASEFAEQGYDLKRLIRGIVLSESYARSSVVSGDNPPPPELFAAAVPRPLTPRQFTASLSVATGSWDRLPAAMEADEWQNRRESMETEFASFRNRLEIPDANFQVGADEALLFSNGESIEQDLLRDSEDRLVGRLKTIDDPEELTDTVFLAVLSRYPDRQERDAVAKYLSAREDRRVDGIQQIVWALVTSPEFRFNH